MKSLLIFFSLLTICLAKSVEQKYEQVLFKDSSVLDSRKEIENFAQINLNVISDAYIGMLGTLLRVVEPVKLPDQTIAITGGSMTLSKGSLTNISTVHRNGDVTFDYTLRERKISFTLPLTFTSILSSYNYQANLLLSTITGDLDAEVLDIALNLILSFDIKQSVAAVDEASSDIRDISIRLDSDSHLSESTKNIIYRAVKPVLIRVLNRTLSEAILKPAQYLVDKINEAIQNGLVQNHHKL